MKTIRRIYRYLRKGIYTFPLGKRYVKLFLPFAFKKSKTELLGNRKALQDSNFSKFVVPLRSFGKFIFLSPRGYPINPEQSKNFVEHIKNQALLNKKYISASELINLKGIPSSLITPSELSTIRKTLSKICLPAGTSHGDLHANNFIKLNNRLAIIDWAMYRDTSSPIFDFLHYHCRDWCENYSVSWTNAVWNDIPAWLQCAEEYSLDLNSLRVLYGIDRISRELEQKSLDLASDFVKYRSTIVKILKLCEDANKTWKLLSHQSL